jgi:hypothetical protein
MASTKGIRAGRAFVELFADDSKLVRGLKAAEKKLKAFGNGIRNLGLKMAALGTAVLTPMIGAAKAFSSMGDQVAKMAKRTGMSVGTLSELRFVASQTGTEFESLEMGFRRMQRSIYDAGRGMSTAVDALADLGLRFCAENEPPGHGGRFASSFGQIPTLTVTAPAFGATSVHLNARPLPLTPHHE